MGSSLTIDKHGTSLDDWIQIQDKLEQTEFNTNPNTHLMIWRFFVDELDQSINSLPFFIDKSTSPPVVSSEEAYVIGFVRKGDYQGAQSSDNNIIQLLSSLRINFNKSSLQVCIRRGVIEGGSTLDKKIQYFTYAYLGKQIKNSLKLTVLSYAYKLGTFLTKLQRIKIITGGYFYKNRKLQIDPIVQFFKKNNNQNKNLSEFHNFHLINELIKNFYQENNKQNARKKNCFEFSLFLYKPIFKVPIMETQKEVKQVSTPSKQNRDSLTNHNKSTHIPPIRPPMLKLALKPFEQVTYEQMDEQQKNQKFQIRDTARHELKMQKFGNDCSMIIEGLYLSGEKIAKDEQMLKKYNISEIINCAGDYCLNWFQSIKSQENPNVPKYRYLTFFLKDSQNQNIQCLFYRVIDFINNALSHRKNVLIHCIQGISRSVTFVIAYLIFTNGYDYKKAESFVKDRRGIACPNNGFMVELIQFYKRLHEKYESLPSPRVFLVSYHCQETPQILTARMLKQKLFEEDGKKFISLDERGIYIIQAEDILYLWVGAKCQDQRKMKKLWLYAQNYIKKLQEFEKAPMKIKAIHQGNEGRDFLSLWGIEKLAKQYQNVEYDRLFNEQKPAPKPGYLRKHYQRDEDHTQEEFISKLFIYPDHENGLGVFELEDLSGLCLLVNLDNDKIKVFVWKAPDWSANPDVEGQFLDKVLYQNYSSYSPQQIEIEEGGEKGLELSQQFLNCFS